MGRLPAAVALILTALVVPAAEASAHSFLVRTSPAAGARLDQAPAEVVLDFSETVAQPPALTVRTGSGETVVTLTTGLDGAGLRARADLPALDDDVYLVAWRVVADDGHATEGEFAFAVGVAPPAVATTATGTSISWPDALAGLAILAGLALAVGGIASHRWLLPGAEPLPPVRAAVAVALGGALGRTLLDLDDLHALWPPGEWSRLADTRPGRFDLVLLAVLTIAALAVRPHLRLSALSSLVAAAAVIAVAGHAGDAAWWAAPATSAHILVAGAWAGALAHLTLVARRQLTQPSTLLREGAARYARFAAISAAATLALGATAALAQLDRPGQVLHTAYGRVLLLKLAMVVVALGLALTARRRALPATGQRVHALATLTTMETAVLGAIVAASALLAATAPPASATSFILGPPPLPAPTTWGADLAGNNMVAVAAASEQLQIRVYAPGGQPPRDVDVEVTGTEPDGTALDVDPRSCGPGCATVGHTWPRGRTTLAVTTEGSGYADGTARLTIDWPPSTDASELLSLAVAATRAAPQLDVTETVRSGPGATAGPYTLTVDGQTFITSEPYANGADDVRALPNDGANRVITFTVPGSNIWQQLWLDTDDRIVREILVDPGHRIDRTINYP